MARSERSEPGWLLSLLGALVLVAGGFLVGLVVGVVSEEPELVVGHLSGQSEEVPWQDEWADEAAFAEYPQGVGGADMQNAGRRERRPDPSAAFEPTDDELYGAVAIDLPSVGAASPELGAARSESSAARAAERRAPPAKASPPAVSAPRAAKSGLTAIDDLPPADGRVATAAFAVQVGAFSESAAANGVRDDLRRKGFDAYSVPPQPGGDQRTRVRVGPVASKSDAQALADRLKREESLPTWVLSVSGN